MQSAHFLQLLLIGLIAASVPLAYVWAKRGGYRKLVWVTLFLTFDLILFGAFTRLTDAGLGCPDWPGCYGTSNPLAADQQIKAAETAQPTGPVTVKKAWIEMTHRYLAMAVGGLIVALTVVAWKQRRESGVSPWPATALLLLVCVQGAFGAWTVTLKLMPLIVTIHLLLAMCLLSVLAWHGARTGGPQVSPSIAHVGSDPVPMTNMGWATLALVFMQIALGGWVSTNYAVLACPDFPLCNGALVPTNADFASGFELLRPLGVLANGRHLAVEALVAIHWVHRAFALIVTAVVVTLAVLLLRARSAGAEENTLARWLLGLLSLQIITGIANVVFTWPLAVAVAHNGGAAALVLVLTLLLARLVPARAPVKVAARIEENALGGFATGAVQRREPKSASGGAAA